MGLIQRVVRRLTGELVPPISVSASERLTTSVFSLYDEPYQPSSRLIQLTLKAVCETEHISLDTLAERPAIQRAKLPQRLTQWPGEHYRFMAALVRVVQPKSVVEIGTYLGWSALAMKQVLPADGSITTFDISAWDSLPDTGLQSEDFVDGRLVQHVADLADSQVAAKYQELLASADLIFMDGPHDGATEYKMVENFKRIRFEKDPIFIFDDIKMPALLGFWRDLPLPKLDITSFGHWSGTGMAEWTYLHVESPA